MANHKSAIKRHRQNLKRKARNRSVKATIRSAIKNTLELKAANKNADAKEAVRLTESMLASAGRKGIFNQKTARRYISRLAKKVAK